jgi:hypothetical protein
MHLFEIKAASFVKKLNELSSTDIDQDLEKTAAQIGKASSAGQDDETETGDDLGAGDFAQAPSPEDGNSPLQAMDDPELATDDILGTGESDEEMDEVLMKKVDTVLVSAAKGHPYARGYTHDESSKIHPYKILSMAMDELQQLRTMARNKANLESFNGELGAMDNPDIKFFQDLVSFADKVISVKKSATKEYNDGKEGKTAKPERRPDSKTKAGKVKSPKTAK